MIPRFALLVFITLVPACWIVIGVIGLLLRSARPGAR
jgi:hypothetical protein